MLLPDKEDSLLRILVITLVRQSQHTMLEQGGKDCSLSLFES